MLFTRTFITLAAVAGTSFARPINILGVDLQASGTPQLPDIDLSNVDLTNFKLPDFSGLDLPNPADLFKDTDLSLLTDLFPEGITESAVQAIKDALNGVCNLKSAGIKRDSHLGGKHADGELEGELDGLSGDEDDEDEGAKSQNLAVEASLDDLDDLDDEERELDGDDDDDDDDSTELLKTQVEVAGEAEDGEEEGEFKTQVEEKDDLEPEDVEDDVDDDLI